jgi:hypothetical protein
MFPSKEQGYKDYKKLDTESIPHREATTNQQLQPRLQNTITTNH